MMADYSVLNYISNYDITKYYVASEVSEPGEGWKYTGINASVTNPLDYAKSIIDSYVDQAYSQTYTESAGKGYTLALFDMDKVSQFLNEYDALIRMMTLAIRTYDYGMIMAILRARAGTIPAATESSHNYIYDSGLLLEGLISDENIYFNSCNDRLREYGKMAWSSMKESVVYFKADFLRNAMTGSTVFYTDDATWIQSYQTLNNDFSCGLCGIFECNEYCNKCFSIQ